MPAWVNILWLLLGLLFLAAGLIQFVRAGRVYVPDESLGMRWSWLRRAPVAHLRTDFKSPDGRRRLAQASTCTAIGCALMVLHGLVALMTRAGR